ncbi:MAG: hypothetical protein AB7P76_10250 [Candidatus Melainabacteria bacterium]
MFTRQPTNQPSIAAPLAPTFGSNELKKFHGSSHRQPGKAASEIELMNRAAALRAQLERDLTADNPVHPARQQRINSYREHLSAIAEMLETRALQFQVVAECCDRHGNVEKGTTLWLRMCTAADAAEQLRQTSSAERP